MTPVIAHERSATGVRAADRRRVPWLVVALAFTVALLGLGLPASVSAATHPGAAVTVLHDPIAAVHPSGLPTLTAMAHAAHPAAAPLAATGPVVAVVLLAFTFARRAAARPTPLRATARRLPPRRAPPGSPFTR